MANLDFQSPKHKRLHNKLKFIGPGPAAFFRDIYKMLYEDSYVLESEVHLISHLFREIESAIRNAIRQPEEKKSTHKDDIKFILRKLEVPLDHPIAKAWLKFADQDFELQFNKLVHRNALLNPRQRHDKIEESWETFLDILDFIIDKAQQNYFDAVHIIDELLQKDNPSDDDGSYLANSIPINDTTLSYLFDQCENPKWVSILKDAGFFNQPPGIVYNEDGSWRYPSWPAGKFLQKMANHEPSDISEIIKDLNEIENLNAIDDLVYALCNMPANIASEHIEDVISWINKGSLAYRTEPYFDFAHHLAKNYYREEALRVLKNILTPDFPDEPDQEDSLFRSLSNYLNISDWEFTNFFKKRLQEFLPHFGFDLVKKLSEILVEILFFENEEPPNDSSYIWLDTLEFEKKEYTGRRHEVKKSLINNIASISNELIDSGENSIEEVTSYFEGYDWYIFKRINMLLYAKGKNIEKIKKILLDKELFDGYGLHREYRSLLKQFFKSLHDKERQKILKWIEEGPKKEATINVLKQWEDEITEKNIEEYKRQWQRRKLYPIAEYLDKDWSKYYDALIDEFGEPDFSQPKIRSHTGPTTPKTLPELQELSVDELAQYLQEWEPEQGFAKPTPEGLGRTVSGLISENSEVYSKHALKFKGLDPTYVRSLFSGLRTALKNNETVVWGPVLELIDWVLKQPLYESDEELYRSKDPGWGWCRSTIADVIKAGCQSNSIPYSFREKVWDYIYTLTNDPQPDEEYEEEYGGNNMDPATLSINTTRGKAMHAAFSYGWWIKKNHEDKDVSFRDMSELKKVLEQHLDPQNDPSLAIRSVYGQQIPSLIQFDEAWLKNNIRNIFPFEEEMQPFFQAAWDAYIAFNDPYNDVFELMNPIYANVLESINQLDDSDSTHLRTNQRFISHLMIFYLRDVIKPGGQYSDLLNKFWDGAPNNLLAYAIEFFGRSLNNWKGEIEADYKERIHIYVGLRIEAAKASGKPENYSKELSAFGWCFASKKLDKKKRMDQLLKILRMTNTIGHGHSVMTRLNDEFVEEYPEEVLECVEIMVKGLERTFDLHAWKSDLKDCLKVLLTKEEPIKKRTSQLIQYICQMNYHLMQEFKSLLD